MVFCLPLPLWIEVNRVYEKQTLVGSVFTGLPRQLCPVSLSISFVSLCFFLPKISNPHTPTLGTYEPIEAGHQQMALRCMTSGQVDHMLDTTEE